MWPQAKDFQGPQSQESRKDPPQETAEGAWCYGRWILTSVLQTVREGTSDDVSPRVGLLLPPPPPPPPPHGTTLWEDRYCARAARQGVCPALPTSPISQRGPCGIPLRTWRWAPAHISPQPTSFSESTCECEPHSLRGCEVWGHLFHVPHAQQPSQETIVDAPSPANVPLPIPPRSGRSLATQTAPLGCLLPTVPLKWRSGHGALFPPKALGAFPSP